MYARNREREKWNTAANFALRELQMKLQYSFCSQLFVGFPKLYAKKC